MQSNDVAHRCVFNGIWITMDVSGINEQPIMLSMVHIIMFRHTQYLAMDRDIIMNNEMIMKI